MDIIAEARAPDEPADATDHLAPAFAGLKVAMVEQVDLSLIHISEPTRH